MYVFLWNKQFHAAFCILLGVVAQTLRIPAFERLKRDYQFRTSLGFIQDPVSDE